MLPKQRGASVVFYESSAMDRPYHFKLNVTFDRKGFSLFPHSESFQMYANYDKVGADTGLVLHTLQV